MSKEKKEIEEKVNEYSEKLIQAIGSLFDEDSEIGIEIDQKELQEGDNLTHFFQSLANVVPNYFYTKITGDKKNNLEFNHIANQLCFQYSLKK